MPETPMKALATVFCPRPVLPVPVVASINIKDMGQIFPRQAREDRREGAYKHWKEPRATSNSRSFPR